MEANCISTHGGSGYASGSYWDGDCIVCGICGFRIENPHPIGGRTEYEFVKYQGILGKLGLGYHKEIIIPTFGHVGLKPKVTRRNDGI